MNEQNNNSKTTTSQEAIAAQQTYEELLAERIAAQQRADAQRFHIPLWMLTGFPARSHEPDEDDPIDFL